MRPEAVGGTSPGEGQDGGREGSGRRTVAEKVRHGAPGALRVVSPRDAGEGGGEAQPALGAGGCDAGGLGPQGAVPAARVLPQQQAQRPQRVSAPGSGRCLGGRAFGRDACLDSRVRALVATRGPWEGE